MSAIEILSLIGIIIFIILIGGGFIFVAIKAHLALEEYIDEINETLDYVKAQKPKEREKTTTKNKHIK